MFDVFLILLCSSSLCLVFPPISTHIPFLPYPVLPSVVSYALYFFLSTYLHFLLFYSPLIIILSPSSLYHSLSSLAIWGPAASGSTEAEGHADSGDSWYAAVPSLHCGGTVTCSWYYLTHIYTLSCTHAALYWFLKWFALGPSKKAGG